MKNRHLKKKDINVNKKLRAVVHVVLFFVGDVVNFEF